MHIIRTCVVLVGAALMTACASTQQANAPLPESTPFDSNPLARQAYLDAYTAGYRSGRNPGDVSPAYTQGPYPFARNSGWRAGSAAAYAEHPAGSDTHY